LLGSKGEAEPTLGQETIMNRVLVWSAAGGVLLAAATGLVIATVEQPQGPAFIAGDKPVTEDQIREKLAAGGWTNVQIVRQGRFYEAIASRDGQTEKVRVDSQTGRLRGNDDDDDDD
jgi:hypothetical protein